MTDRPTPTTLGALRASGHHHRPVKTEVRENLVDLLRSGVPVHGLAHITGGGLRNLLRLNDGVGFAIEEPLAVPAICTLVAHRGGIGPAEMWDVFNMGCGFCVVVPAGDEDAALALLQAHYPAAARIGVAVAGERQIHQ